MPRCKWKDLGIHLHRRIRVVERQHQVAAAFAQRVHRITDVRGDQSGRDIQAFVTQLRDPAWEEAQRQGVGGGHLHDFALPAFKMMQMAQHFTELFDHGARSHQEQLPRRRQFNRRTRAIDQGQAQRGFQTADASAECRLSDKTPFRRLGKAAGSRQGAEVFQPFALKVHYFLPRVRTTLAHTPAMIAGSHAHYAVYA